MKTSPAFLPSVLALVALTCAVIALLEYAANAELITRLDVKVANMRQARQLALKHPDLFGPAGKTKRVDLKMLVQAVSAKYGVAIVYLNENEQEAGEKAREIIVVARAINVSQEKLVLFLADVEAGADGARFKDLRLRPKAGRANEYEEAEAILSLRIERQQAAGSHPL